MSIPYLQPLLRELRENSRITHWIQDPSIVPTSFTNDPGGYIYQKRNALRGIYARNFTSTMAKRGGALLAVNYTGAFQRSMVSFLQTPVMIMRSEVIRDSAQRASGDKDIYSRIFNHIQFLLSQ